MEDKKFKKLDKLSNENLQTAFGRIRAISIMEHIDMAFDVYKKIAIQGIEANTIVINDKLAQSKYFKNYFPSGGALPTTVMGLNIQYSDELPNNANFMIYHSSYQPLDYQSKEPDNSPHKIRLRDYLDIMSGTDFYTIKRYDKKHDDFKTIVYEIPEANIREMFNSEKINTKYLNYIVHRVANIPDMGATIYIKDPEDDEVEL